MKARNTIAAIIAAAATTGCAGMANPTHTDMVTMDRSGVNYAEDSIACREIAETRDYFAEMMGEAIAKGLTAGIAGGITGAAIGSLHGEAGYGAAVGAAVAGGSVAVRDIAVDGLQKETATTVWAKCMVSKGHPVYSIKLH
jgi:hypothetical protein